MKTRETFASFSAVFGGNSYDFPASQPRGKISLQNFAYIYLITVQSSATLTDNSPKLISQFGSSVQFGPAETLRDNRATMI